jgi:hypothetical protein
MPDIETFKLLAKSMSNLEGENPILGIAREGVEQAMNAWIDEAQSAPDRVEILKTAISHLYVDQLQKAVAEETSVYGRLLIAMGDLSQLDLGLRVIRNLSNAEVEYLKDRGFQYDVQKHHSPAEEWLVRGAAYGEAKFRDMHPRKCPVAAIWENNGLMLPREGLCQEGAEMVAEVIRRRRLSKAVQNGASRDPRSTDWRVALCMKIEGVYLPYDVMRLMIAVFGTARYEAISAMLNAGQSNHEKLARQSRIARLPSYEEILLMPRYPESFDPILEEMGFAPKAVA